MKWVLIVLLVFLVLLATGFIYEKIRRDSNVTNYPSISNSINYNGENIHFIKKGEGKKTVVFSSGNGTASPYIDMYNLQNEISDDTETLVYERPGYGWSDQTSNERGIANITKEIEAVLNASTENEEFIFVGHSMAALEVFHYAQKHPEKVKGIVLIDGVNPEYASEMKKPVPMSIHIMKALKSTGVVRLLSNIESVKSQLNQNKNVPDDIKDVEIERTLHNMWNSTMIAERKKLPDNGQKVIDGKGLGDIPLILFSAENNPMKGWKESQEELPSWSEDSKQIWIETENHFIHYEQPEKIVKEIKSLLN